jgi:phosphoribosyl 1,2-cyclic phosphodiesterase
MDGTADLKNVDRRDPAHYRCAVAVHLTILGSGSAGNCAYVETGGARILVDAGLSPRQIRTRLASIGKAPENLTAILITHEHSDHIQGLVGIAQKLGIPVYCNRATREETERVLSARLDCRLFETRASFEIGDVVVDTFDISHDAQDPVGFLLRTPSGNIGFATDLGCVTKHVLDRIRQANVLLLEANHDVALLRDCPRRPWSLKQRILGRQGHLSNEAAAETAEQIMSAELRHLYLGHLSRECNRPEIAHRVVSETLARIGARHVGLEVTQQAVPCATLSL